MSNAPDLDAILDDLRRLVEVESFSEDPEGLRRCAETFIGILERRVGGTAELGGDARVRWRTGDGSGEVLVLGHLDTVWPPGTIERKPFAVDGGSVTGPGIFDMKAGLVVAVHALAHLRADGSLPPVEVLATTDEETGSRRSREEIEDAAIRCGRVLVPEPCGPDGAVKRARKGVAMGTIEVTGRASHAGLAPERGINAAVALGALLPRIADLGDPDAGTTVVPTVVRAGSTTNTVPADASAAIDVRFLEPAEVERVRAALAGMTAEDGAEVHAELEVNRPPMTPASSEPLVQALRDAAAAVDQRIGTVTSGGASDGNFAAASGAYVLDGLAPPGRDPHAETEQVELAGLVARVRLLAELIPRVAVVPTPPPSAPGSS